MDSSVEKQPSPTQTTCDCSIWEYSAIFLLFTIIITSTILIWLLRPKSNKIKKEDPEKDKNKDKQKTKEKRKQPQIAKQKPQIKKKNEAIKPKQHVLLQNEIWQDLTDWIPSIQLAKGLSLVNSQMHEICAKKLYEDGEHVVNEIWIEKKGDNSDDDDYYCGLEEDEDGGNEGNSNSSSSSSEEEEESTSSEDEEDAAPAANVTGKKKKKKAKKKEEKEKDKKEKLRVRKFLWNTEISELVQLSLPTTPPPNNIIGFRKISIRHMNEQVMAFLRAIKPLFSRGDGIPFQMNPRRNRDAKSNFQQFLDVHRLLQGTVSSMLLDEESFFDPYWKLLRPFLFNVQFLIFEGAYLGSDRTLPILARWLQTTRTDGAPRYFYAQWSGRHNDNRCRRLIDMLRESFTNTNANSSINNSCTYILEMDVHNLDEDDDPLPEPFLLRNDRNERLALGRHQHSPLGDNHLVLRRFPALPTSIGNDWMVPVLDRARQLFTTRISKYQYYSMDDSGNVKEGPLNQLKLSFECPYNYN